MIIDCHQHVFWKNHDDRWLVDEMDRLGIDKAWLLTWYLPAAEDDPAYHRAQNPIHLRPDGTHGAVPFSDVILACRRYPDRFIPGYIPCPTEGHDPAALFEAAYHMHGVRVCGEWSYRTLLDDPRAINLFRKCGELKCPVLIHMDVPFLPDGRGGWVYQNVWCGGTIANFARALEACPETTFIGHAPGFWREISGDADTNPAGYPAEPAVGGGKLFALFDEHPNLCADLSARSGLNAMKRLGDRATEFLGRCADRLLYGRDNYGNDLQEYLNSLDLDPDVREKIYHRNAEKLLGET